jgi:succinoglycan biosynthesis transport protein ExoP
MPPCLRYPRHHQRGEVIGLEPIVLAVLGGFVLLVVAWLATRAVRSRVTTVADVESATGLVVIGPISGKGLRRPLQSLNGLRFRTEPDGLERICRLLQHNGLGTAIKVLTVVPASSSQVGSGFAVNLARTLAAEETSVLLILADLRHAVARSTLGLSDLAGLAELLEGDPRDPVMALVSVTDHLLVLPCGRAPDSPAELLARPALGEIIGSLRDLGLITIIDAPPASFAADVVPLAREADATLLIVQSGSGRPEVEVAARVLRYGGAGDPAAVLVGTRRLRSLAVGMPPRPSLETGSGV